MVYIAYIKKTGEPVRAAMANDWKQAIQNWADLDGVETLESSENLIPDLKTVWIKNSQLVNRADISDDPAVIAAEKAQAQAKAAAAKIADLATTDQPFIRVLEDLIQALIDKKTIALTDLPQPVQDKIAARKALRAKL